ncbi:hypothetical protein B0O99DRAFT_684760 [Bisporella sp. PMI_857]|nr:hypothetical protein B0O99DRAFT_684760 [Bisporella sp. PMI_857]
MAIHESLPGVEVTICVDGEALKEYEAENEEAKHEIEAVRLHQAERTVTKFVESVTGKVFCVKIQVHPSCKESLYKLGFETLVDGVRAMEPLISRRAYCTSTMEELILGFTHRATSTLQRFMFAEIKTKADGTNLEKINKDRDSMAQVGEIQVYVHRLDNGIQQTKCTSQQITLNRSYEDEIHEKALKGESKSHGVVLGTPEPITNGKVFKCKNIDGKDYPRAIFKFKYRSTGKIIGSYGGRYGDLVSSGNKTIEALKQLLVIERTPEPEPNILDAIEDLTAEERREVADVAARLRKRRLASDRGNSINTKSEVDESPSKRARKSENIVIVDLTED